MGPPAKNRISTPRKTPTRAASSVKKPTRPNASILNFFKKVEAEEPTLFVGQDQDRILGQRWAGVDEAEDGDDVYGLDGENGPSASRFNEITEPVKRRRLSPQEEEELFGMEEDEPVTPPADTTVSKPLAKKPVRRMGPFLEDSDTEEEEENDGSSAKKEETTPMVIDEPEVTIPMFKAETPPDLPDEPPQPPLLEHHDTSFDEFQDTEDYGDLDGIGDEELGEEYREMRYMQEQARLEAEEAGDFSYDHADISFRDDSMTKSCPICSGSLAGLDLDAATRHVNECLDGAPIPLPAAKDEPERQPPTVEGHEVSKRFARAAVARPGQANPFDLNGSTGNGSASAFTKLMSGHAEDAAWSEAAAAENASRGKPAYQRTCPFYKIMPGFSICVDAFRYGKVEGCSAYFLSHFHSDHYVGLTANWAHGPIYCSKVTGSLVKAQLRTAAHWVKELEFEETVEVPGTEGVTVTMIPANHCPGSSLFLFEKTMGKGPKGRVQRILHCGDFRACPGHVMHPLLKPEIVDAVSGKARQQKIDVCYLDTTYLNPRYSFPPQDDVIRACADLCATMSPDPESQDDLWGRLKRDRNTDTMSKYFAPTSNDADIDGSNAASKRKGRILVICGTYSIGKERICKAIAQALGSKIYASPAKIKICAMLGDPELTALMTPNPIEAQVHMQMLMEIRAETLQDYLDSYKPHFSRIVGFRPSGWNYRPANNNAAAKLLNHNTQPSAVATTQLLHGKAWRSRFTADDFAPQRGSTKTAMCFGVPYSEHSSFRELALFTMALRIEKVVPTVNVGNENSRRRMKAWTDRWLAERRRGGFVKPLVEGQDGEVEREVEKGKREAETKTVALWEGKDGRGGGAWW